MLRRRTHSRLAPEARRRLAAAIGISIAAHALFLAVALLTVTVPVLREPEPTIEVFTAFRSPVSSGGTQGHSPLPAGVGAGSDGQTAAKEKEPAATEGVDRMEGTHPLPPPGGRGEPTLKEIIDEQFRRERFANGPSKSGSAFPGAPGSKEGRREATDSVDGIPRLGSGEPGDPRIPGSGGVDIAAVITRDATVGIAQERARQGVIHPFLAEAKTRIENCWLPVTGDALAATDSVKVADEGCSKKFHIRHRVGRVFAVYDAKGAKLSIYIHGGVSARALKDRVQQAIEEAGMGDVPVELLDDEGYLRLAWNVYIDDYRGCGLIGTGANAHKPGGDIIIGIVELDGVY